MADVDMSDVRIIIMSDVRIIIMWLNVWLNVAAGSFSRNGQRSQRDSQSEICTSTSEKILKTISCASSLLLSLCH